MCSDAVLFHPLVPDQRPLDKDQFDPMCSPGIVLSAFLSLRPIIYALALGLAMAVISPPGSANASTAERLVDAARGQVADWLIPFFLAMLPIVELRGAIPVR